MQRQQQKLAGLYCRLSRDDGGDSESNSIQNQREMLRKYCKQNLLPIYSEYVDDGFSGVDFERDGFKQMISDIERGKISIVVCKDLSRLGRNNALVAYYTEIYFLENNIRFIAVNDGIDSAVGENEIMGFKSVINEFYARDISKKIRSVKATLAEKGKRTGGQPPLGYMPDPEDKNHYVINPETAPIVKRMFTIAAEGGSIHGIAKAFTEEGILSPRDAQSGVNSGVEWSVTSVHRMLKNKAYLGCMIYNTHYKPSFKSRKTIANPESEWVIMPDMHEPIIDKELFDLVQKRLSVRKRKPKDDFDNVFVGIVKCADCGTNMSLASDKRQSGTTYYLNCHKYRKFSKEGRCTMHYINYRVLYDLVLAEISENITIANANQHRIEDFIRGAVKKNCNNGKNATEVHLAKLSRRKDELDKVIERLFESSTLGSLSTERFHEMLSKYESERSDIVAEISKLSVAKLDKTDIENDYKRFFQLMRQYRGMTELSATMLNELIDKIVVHESQGARGKKTQRVEIHYRFVEEGLCRGVLYTPDI